MAVESVDCVKHISVFGKLLEILEIIMSRAVKLISDNQSILENILKVFQRGVEKVMEAIKTFLLKNKYFYKFGDTCEVSFISS